MAASASFKRLFLCALAPQVVLWLLLLAFGLGGDTVLFNLLATFYAPVVFGLAPLLKLSNSWAAIGLFTLAFPLVGAVLYSWLFAILATRLARATRRAR
jgi:hypothetical protein